MTIGLNIYSATVSFIPNLGPSSMPKYEAQLSLSASSSRYFLDYLYESIKP